MNAFYNTKPFCKILFFKHRVCNFPFFDGLYADNQNSQAGNTAFKLISNIANLTAGFIFKSLFLAGFLKELPA
jgi:hypothetical protein